MYAWIVVKLETNKCLLSFVRYGQPGAASWRVQNQQHCLRPRSHSVSTQVDSAKCRREHTFMMHLGCFGDLITSDHIRRWSLYQPVCFQPGAGSMLPSRCCLNSLFLLTSPLTSIYSWQTYGILQIWQTAANIGYFFVARRESPWTPFKNCSILSLCISRHFISFAQRCLRQILNYLGLLDNSANDIHHSISLFL